MQRILIPGQGGGLLLPRKAFPQAAAEEEVTLPTPAEKTEWDKLRERSNAMKLIAEVEAKAAPIVADLKKLDESGQDDLFPEKGQAGYANRQVSGQGLGFISQVTESHDAFLRFDTTSGEVQEFRQRVVREGDEQELAIVREDGDTVYSRTQGTWREIAIAHADGTFSSQKQIRITPEMQEMLKLQLAMKLAGGGGMGEDSPF
ncbi:MAG: hypothetical protein AMXMBFR33_24750 [Candidatus Xenobia bacterium]|jgi:cold shock CspA family protein